MPTVQTDIVVAKRVPRCMYVVKPRKAQRGYILSEITFNFLVQNQFFHEKFQAIKIYKRMVNM